MARCPKEVNDEILNHLHTIKMYQGVHFEFISMSDQIYDKRIKLYRYAIFSDEGKFDKFSNIPSLEMNVKLKPKREELLDKISFIINNLLEELDLSYQEYYDTCVDS